MTGSPSSALLATGDRETDSLLHIALRNHGWQVCEASTGSDAMTMTSPIPPDVAVLGLALPDLDSITVMHRLRALHREVAILFLTDRQAVTSRVALLDAGGDDCLSWPFSLDEVVARVTSLARRARCHLRRSGRTLVVGDLLLDEDAMEVTRDGIDLKLTTSEFRLLRFLMQHRRVVSSAELLRCQNPAVLREPSPEDRALMRKRISHLRRKLDEGRSPMIHTGPGGGYLLKAA